MKTYHKFAFSALASVFAAAGLVSCDVEKTQDGEMPEVEVKGETKLPKYDVDAPDVDVTTKKKEIEVPDIEITPADEDTNDQ
ncbi:hypothetical protein [Luteolibacter sp. AS25]|uniref:hypothetical protein n=1 Tax=Luteolibacter sp. AS25 TaxID=3135776 RepID=UPI00398ABA79